ncbi:MAG: 50S ribosomal protein L11 methyltransferase [Candidatus Thalassarchaeaceae archaeon]|jgi:putative methylase|nr:50S ribosomal protein L11 methyltransferase [Candidatus Thalassarchaeaceae archaeon]
MAGGLRQLAIALSQLTPHPCSNVELEQYSLEGELAARWLMDIIEFGDLTEGCMVADLGCGNGIMAIGALHLGAGTALAIEADEEALGVAKSNLKGEGFWQMGVPIHATIGVDDLDAILGAERYSLSDVDLVISNPPWGRQKQHADRPFFQAIINCGATAHLLHSANATHIEPFFSSAGWNAEKYGTADFALPANYEHHTSQRNKTRVAFWRLTPNN